MSKTHLIGVGTSLKINLDGVMIDLAWRGDPKLFGHKSFGFAGSRKATDRGVVVARRLTKMAVSSGFTVVSGGAAGVDMAVHHYALELGGTTVIVLPVGISYFESVMEKLIDVWNWEKVLIVSQFDRNQKWEVSTAMKRNQVVVALSTLMAAIQPSDKGGTRDAINQANKQNVPLYTYESGGDHVLDRF